MSAKQDRTGARTAADLERKYNFGQSFAEVMEIATDARDAADEANEATKKLDGDLNSEEIFKRLTNNGTLQGLYRGEDGELYINASYIKSGEILADLIKTGIISSKDGTVKIDLTNNRVTIDGTRNGFKTQVILSSSGIKGLGESFDGAMENVLDILIGVGGMPSGIVNTSTKESGGLDIGTVTGDLLLGDTEPNTKIIGNTVEIKAMGDLNINTENGSINILGKAVYWKDNGDGTYSLAAYG